MAILEKQSPPYQAGSTGPAAHGNSKEHVMRITKTPEVRRQEIIEAARVLFEEQGIAGTAMTDLAEKIGVAKGLVYYYFSSKEQLVEAVIDQFIGGLDQTLQEILQQGRMDFHEKLTAILTVYFQTIQSHPAIFADTPVSPGLFSRIRERLSDIALSHALLLLQMAISQNLIRIEYPEYMLRILIRGLGDLYIEGVHEPQVHATLIEQTLGLEKGQLRIGSTALGRESGDKAAH